MIRTKRGTTLAILMTTLLLSISLCIIPLLKTSKTDAAVYDVVGSGNLACVEYNADGYRFSGSSQMQLAREALLGEESFNKFGNYIEFKEGMTLEFEFKAETTTATATCEFKHWSTSSSKWSGNGISAFVLDFKAGTISNVSGDTTSGWSDLTSCISDVGSGWKKLTLTYAQIMQANSANPTPDNRFESVAFYTPMQGTWLIRNSKVYLEGVTVLAGETGYNSETRTFNLNGTASATSNDAIFLWVKPNVTDYETIIRVWIHGSETRDFTSTDVNFKIKKTGNISTFVEGTPTVDLVSDGAEYVAVKIPLKNLVIDGDYTSISVVDIEVRSDGCAATVKEAYAAYDTSLGAKIYFDGVLYTDAFFKRGEKITTRPTDPTKLDYTFKGWSLDGTSVVNFNTFTVNADTLEFVSLWTPVQVGVNEEIINVSLGGTNVVLVDLNGGYIDAGTNGYKNGEIFLYVPDTLTLNAQTIESLIAGLGGVPVATKTRVPTAVGSSMTELFLGFSEGAKSYRLGDTIAVKDCMTLDVEFSSDVEFKLKEDGTLAIKKAEGKSSYALKDLQPLCYTVTEICDDAFAPASGYNQVLMSVEVPNTVTKVGKRAFKKCSALVSVKGLENCGNCFLDETWYNTDLSLMITAVDQGVTWDTWVFKKGATSESFNYIVTNDMEGIRFGKPEGTKFADASVSEDFATVYVPKGSTTKMFTAGYNFQYEDGTLVPVREYYTITFEVAGVRTVQYIDAGAVDVGNNITSYNKTARNFDRLTITPPDISGLNASGWTDGTNTYTNDFTSINKNVVLTPKYGERVTLTFNGADIEPLVIGKNSVASTPAVPVKEGYTFAGWYENATFTTSFDFSKPVTSSKTVYVKWIPTIYQITYNLNGGTNPVCPTFYKSTDSFALPKPTKENYIFGGWYKNAEFTGEPIDKIEVGMSGNLQLHAMWSQGNVSYTINYNLNGGTNPANAPATYLSATGLTLPMPTKNGYSFVGWCTDSACATTPITRIEIGTTGNKTLYAKWGSLQYTITYVLNGGTNPSNAPTTYTADMVVQLKSPTKAGCTFQGWYTNASFTGSKVSAITIGTTGNKTFYAKWSGDQEIENAYTITYVLYGGTGATSTTYTQDSGKITLPTPTKKGYMFNGWFNNKQFTGEAITEIASGSTGNKVFYAKFTIDTYTITYNVDGGEGVENSTYTVESGLVLPIPTKAGYVFEGWYKNENFTGKEVVQIVNGETGDKVFYAKWKIDENAQTGNNKPTENKGCKSSIVGVTGLLSIVALGVATMVVKSRKED